MFFQQGNLVGSSVTIMMMVAGPAVSPGGLASLIILMVLVVSLFGWTGYAYFYPHTWSGQLLIKVGHPTDFT